MFSKFFIYRPVFAMVISIVIVIIGGISIVILPVESMPDITPPTVKVTTSFPGASATVVEQTVTQPIEQQVNGVEDMIYMQSKSTAAGALDLTVTFEIGTDPDMAAVLTQNRVSVAEPLLPEEVKRQGLQVKKQSTQLTLMVNLFSPDGRFNDLFLSNYATTQVKDVLARVPGVGEVQNMGAKDFGMRIWLKPDLLRSRGLTTDEVVQALREQNVQVAAGKVGAPPNPAGLNFEYNINTLGRLESPDEFASIILKTGESGQLVRLRDVADVELGAQDYSWYVQLDGEATAALGVYQLPGANALGVKESIVAEMERLSGSFPEGLDWRIVYDSTQYIEASIAEVVETLIIAILLVIFSVYLFLQDWRTTLIPSITIPVSLIGTFGLMVAMDMSINNLTLFGLVLAIGIVVDDSIVVVENTMRIIDTKGLEAKEATAESMGEIAGAVIATTLVLLAVFIPTTMMPGLTGRLYQQFAITISVAVLLSSVNALTLAPALCGILLRPSKTSHGRFFTWFNNSFDRTTGRYMGVVGGLLRKAGVSTIALGGLFALTYFGVVSLPTGFLPNEDQGYFFVNAELPNGASAERTEAVLDKISSFVAQNEDVEGFITIGGYSFLNGVQGSNYGALIIVLKPWSERSPYSLRDAIMGLQAQMSQIQEAFAFAFIPPPINGLGNASGFTMELQNRGGFSYNQLEMFAKDIVAAGQASPVITRLNQNFSANVPQLFADVDRERVKTYNIPLQTVFSTLQANLGSAYVNDFNAFGRSWKVFVQAEQSFRARPEDIRRLEVRDATGNMIPISTLATISDTVGPQVVNRFNMFPSATVSGVPMPGYSSGQATAELERIAGEKLPLGMGYQWSGVTYQEQAAGNLAPIIFSLAILFAFLFLAAQYESWGIPFAVMLSVPFAVLGAAVFTWLRGFDNNIYMQIGLVLLIGLSAKTAILIVEFAKQLHEDGKPILDAALEAARLRFRPILMTAVSFILGVIPLAIATGAGAMSRQSLGTAVLGGMFIATALGVFAIPLLYLLVQTAIEKMTRSGSKVTSVPTRSAGDASDSSEANRPNPES